MRKTIKFILPLFLVSYFVYSCGEGSGTEPSNTFDRTAMLQNFAQNLIRPAFQALQTEVNQLKEAGDNFVDNPSEQTLTNLQNAWEEAYLAWQYANAYNFGPAGEEGTRKGLIEEIGTFPVATDKIENAITANSANFNDFNRDARGFLAVEYLIFDLDGNNQDILDAFAAENRKNFLSGALANLKTRIDEVVNAWAGTYQNTFTSNNGTDVGSSTSQLYNEFVKSFESLKNFKLGLPLGKRPGQTQTEPQRVEAYYSGKTLQMMKAHLTAVEEIWLGKTKNGQDGTGFKEYLASVEGGNALITATENQLTVVKNALNAIPESPSIAIQIENNTAALELLHTELQRHTRFFKSDMSSLLGIAITFSSGDGD